MRTVRATLINKIDTSMELTLETEVIVEDEPSEEELRDAGRQAFRVFSEFNNGFGEDTDA